MAQVLTGYPANLQIDYPDRELNRLTTFFRLFVVIPIWIILALLVGASWEWGRNASQGQMMLEITATGIVFLPLVLMLLFRRKYPKWWYDWNLALTRFAYRVTAFFALMRDEYPSTDEEQAVHIDFAYPDAMQLNRWLPLVKWLLAIPHGIVLFFLAIAAFVCAVFSWFAILFTGRYPRALFDFIEGVMRWGLRVEAYALLLITDQYPPFRLGP